MRRKLLGAVIAVMVLAAAHTAYWFYLQRELADGFSRWAASARQSGFTVAETSAKAGGWPFSVDLVIRDLAIEGGGMADVELGWWSPRTVLRLPLTNPFRLVVLPAGVQRLRAGAAPGITLEFNEMQAVLSFGAGHVPESLDLVGSTLTARQTGTPSAADTVSIGTVQAHCDLARLTATNPPGTPPGNTSPGNTSPGNTSPGNTSPGNAPPDSAPAVSDPAGTNLAANAEELAFAANAEAIVLPSSRKWPLGSRVSSASVEGKVIGRLSDAKGLAHWAGTWRDAGGALEVERLAFGWGPLGVTAAATLALDDQLQPMGTGTARLIGYPAALDALAAGGALSRSAVIATKAILSLLSSGSGDNDAGEVEVPLTLQYRTLSIRQVPLVRLPEVDWGPR